MKMTVRRNRIFVALVALLLSFGIALGAISTVSKASAAENNEVVEDSYKIAHLTDTHVYPLLYCKPTDEFYDHVKGHSTKPWIEAETVFRAALAKIKAEKPDYLVITGDIAQDGERMSHILVANALRQLQNELRADVPHFQVFVVFGNHCLYNPDVYDFSDGTKKKHVSVTRKEVSKIYSSLGFPDLTDLEAEAFYGTIKDGKRYDLDVETLYPEYGFINSSTAVSVDIIWQYVENGLEDDADYAPGNLTYVANAVIPGKAPRTFMTTDVPESNAAEGHVLGGMVTKATKAFLTDTRELWAADYAVGAQHHSILNHWKYEEQITTGFIVGDWRDRADFLADLGVRYVFTGHVHSNDIAHHVSFNNNQITDIQTAANVSIHSSVRYSTIETGKVGDMTFQNFKTKLIMNERVDFTPIIEKGLLTKEYLEWHNVKDFMDGNFCTDYSAYARQRVYLNQVRNTLAEYLDRDTLVGMVTGIADNLPDFLKSLKPILGKIVNNLFDEVGAKVLKDYTYGGTNPKFADGEEKLLGFADELVGKLLDIDVGEYKLAEFFFDLYLGHCVGTEAESYAALTQKQKDALEYVKSGGLLKEMIAILLDKDSGLYFLLEGLLTTPLDLAKGDADIASSFRFIGAFIGYKLTGEESLDASNIVLQDVAKRALESDFVKNMIDLGIDLGNMTVMEFLDDVIDSYLTESLYDNLSEIVYDIAYAFWIDDSFDGNTTEALIKLSKDDTYTYTSVKRADVATIENGKIPSMLTVTFGNDTAKTKNFTWFTDKRITDSTVQYMEVSKGDFSAAKASIASANAKIYCYTMPLIDIGLWAQLGYNEIARHTVEITGLKPNTEYYYRVGSAQYGYYSEVYTFKTGSDTSDTPFELLLIADLQGFTAETYSKISEVMAGAQTVFENGYDFIINVGDAVDNSRNMHQFGYLLNGLKSYWGNTTQVVATGNHEEYNFEYNEKYETSSSSVITDAYNNLAIHYNFAMPAQDTVKGKGMYYSFDYSGVHFAVLNTNDIEKDKLGTKQAEWLENDLKNTTKEFKVVVMHKSLYSSGSHSYDADIIGMRPQLGAIFEKYGVHLVLGGHDHTYTETYYIDKDGNKVSGANNGSYEIGSEGILYVTLGTMGSKYYKYVENEDIPVYTGKNLHDPYLSNPTFGKLVFDGEKLYYQGYQYDYETKTVSEIHNNANLTTMLIIVCAATVAVVALAIVLAAIAKKRRNR